VLWTAVREDEILKSNPCRIPGANKGSASERPHPTLAQVNRLMQAMPDRYRVMILLAAMASLRCDEITALLQQAD
jgi:alkylhydroperoxidase/carboxymuconolactone decarboxylase family protein YurZ